MPDAHPNEARALPRWSLFLVAGAHGLILAWAGTKLPWSEWSTFAIVCWLLAIGHFATAVAAAGRLRGLALTWQISSALSLLVLLWLSWSVVRSATYLAALYGDLGQGIGAAMLAVLGLFALLTVPLSAWGLAATWQPRNRKPVVVSAGVLVIAASLGSWREVAAARAEPMPVPTSADGSPDPAQFERDLRAARAAAIPDWQQLPAIPTKARGGKDQRRHRLRVPSLASSEPIACVPDPSDELAVAVVSYLVPSATKSDKLAPVEPVSRCVRAAPDQLATEVVDLIAREAQRGPVKVDLIVGVAPLRSRGPMLDMFAIRPGLDGICDDEVCLMPWQLVASDLFVANEPIGWVPDFRVGVSPVALRHALGFEVSDAVAKWDRQRRDAGKLAKLEAEGGALAKPDGADELLAFDGLARIETQSFVFEQNGELIALIRGHERDLLLSQDRLDHALELAETHIARASQPDGRFRYLLDPFTGEQQSSSWNLPRQAGTTLVMCELGRDEPRTRDVAARSLAFMAKRAREVGELRPLTKGRNSPTAGLGSTALPAIAFYSCRPRVGPEHDQTLVGMTKFLLALQRDDGSFYPELDLASGAPVDGPEPMYAGGQATFALILAEQLAIEQPETAAAIGLPSAARLGEAVERAMNYYAGPYWDTFAREFFWLEENWHCLAARAALRHHRNEGYEQFCVDYMTYKSRVVLDQASDVAPEFWGGYSFGNVLTPVNTPAAGFAEGLAAAMAIKHARGEDLSEDRARMRQAIEFLVRQQWHENTCFACAPNRPVLGGFSESMSAPEIRIDYTQHAWAGLGHGGAWIVDELPGAEPELVPGD